MRAEGDDRPGGGERERGGGGRDEKHGDGQEEGRVKLLIGENRQTHGLTGRQRNVE